MRLAKLNIQNFRCLRDVSIEFESLTALLGRNGAGKSTVLAALNHFFSPGAQVHDYDRFNRDPSLDIRIDAHFVELSDAEKTEFGSYVLDDRLVVSKIMTLGGVQYVGSRMQFPPFADVRSRKAARDQIAAFNEIVADGKYEGLSSKVRSQADMEAAMIAFESRHPDDLEPIESPTQFFGPTSVGGGKLDNFTKFVYVPAVRDASSELDRRGAISQLIDLLVRRRVEAREDVQRVNAEIAEKLAQLYSRENLTELADLEALITRVLGRYVPGSGVTLDFAEIEPPKVSLPSPVAALIEDNFRSPISYAGHGLQRALIMALLEMIATTEEGPNRSSNAGAGDAGNPDQDDRTPTPPDVILAIEEPELYLHPARSRELSRTLGLLADRPRDGGNGLFQVILTTHSPYFVELRRFSGVRVSRKISAEGVDTLASKVYAYSLAEAARALAGVHERDPAEFTADSFIAHSTSVLTALVNEGFFSDVAVIVEGLSEVGALSAIQEILELDWQRRGIVIVPAMGKTNLDRPYVVFRGLNIPVYMIFDGDSEKEKDKENVRRNRALLRLVGAEPADFPGDQVQDNWASFDNCLEGDLATALGDRWEDTRAEVACELGYPRPSEVVKSAEGAALIVRRAYKQGKPIPHLEQIARKISVLSGLP